MNISSRNMIFEDRIADRELGPTFYSISPELASRFLIECNTQNRGKSRSRAKMYYDLIINNKWSTSRVHTIIFDTRGVLIDGQTRLEAIAMHDKSVNVWVVVGVDPAERLTVDTGRRRSVTDVLKLTGHRITNDRGELTNLITKVASNLSRIHNGKWLNNFKPGPEQTVEAAEKYVNELEFIATLLEERAKQLKDNDNTLPTYIKRAGFLTGSVEIIHCHPDGKEFVSSVINETCLQLPEFSPARTLLKRLITDVNGGGSNPQADRANTVHAWNLKINNQLAKKLKAPKTVVLQTKITENQLV